MQRMYVGEVCAFRSSLQVEFRSLHSRAHSSDHPPQNEPGPSGSSQQRQRATANRSDTRRQRREREWHERERLQRQSTVGVFMVLLRVCRLTGREKLAPRPPPVSLPTPPPTQNHSTNCHRVLPVARQPYREPSQRHDLGRMKHECIHCGALHWLSERSTGNGSSNAHPLFTMCCNQGEIELLAMEPPPEGLTYLFTAATPQANRFHQHTRQYNAALAFTSLGVEVDNTVNEGGGGPPTFRIHGEMHHQLGSLLPRHGERPVYVQLYIYDPSFEIDAAQWISFPNQKAVFPWSGTIPDAWAHKPMPNPNNVKFVSVTGIFAGTRIVGALKRFRVDIASVTFLGTAPPVYTTQGKYTSSCLIA